MLNDFPKTVPHCYLNWRQQCPLVQWLDLALRPSIGWALPQMKPTSQINRLWGNSIILIAPKYHQNPGTCVGTDVTSMVGKAEWKTILALNIPTICLVVPGIPFTLAHALYSTLETQTVLVRVLLAPVTSRHQISFFF